ncbi:hypothetical protein C0J52_19542, partial [Blattella germanica]
DGLTTDKKILFCNFCQCAVCSTQKILVQQHIKNSKHQSNKERNSKQKQLFLTETTTSKLNCPTKLWVSYDNRVFCTIMCYCLLAMLPLICSKLDKHYPKMIHLTSVAHTFRSKS